MKSSLTYLVLALVVFAFGGCKTTDEVNTTIIEEKLQGDWDVDFRLNSHICSGTSAIVSFNGHEFTYDWSGCQYEGTWRADYFTNRSGQFFKIYFDYIDVDNSNHYFSVFEFKYDASTDSFYYFDAKTSSLSPMVKSTFIPAARSL